MAWIRWRRMADGQRTATVEWRDPRTKRKVSAALATPNPEAAEAERQRIERDVEKKPPRLERTDASLLLKGFLDSRRAQHCTERTVGGYRFILQRLFTAWEGRPVRRWRRADLEAYIAAHPKWSPGTIHHLITASKIMIKWAREAGRELPDFVSGLRAPRHSLPPRHALSGAQVTALLAAARGTRLEVPVALAALAGLSLGDLRQITWEEIDLDHGTVRRRRRKSGILVELPFAKLPLLADVLTRHRATHGPVCRDLPESDSALTKDLNALMQGARVPRPPGQSWHLLRRSCGTMLAEAGVPIHVIAAWLGHARGSTITLRYLVAGSEAMDRAATALSGVLTKAAAANG